MENISPLQREVFWLKFANYSTATIAIISIVVSIISDSAAILLDGSYTVVCVLTDICLIMCYKQLDKPQNNKFQFGYYKLEPLVLVIQAVAILVECKLALVASVRDLFHPSELISHIWLALSSQALIGCWCVLISMIMQIQSKRYKSDLLKIQASAWLMGSLQSFFIAGGYLCAVLLKTSKYNFIMPYIDPILTIILVIIFVKLPISIIKDSVADLLDMNYKIDQEINFTNLIKTLIADMGISIQVDKVQFRKAGRKYFLYVVCKPEDTFSGYDLFILDKKLNLAISQQYERVEVHTIMGSANDLPEIV